MKTDCLRKLGRWPSLILLTCTMVGCGQTGLGLFGSLPGSNSQRAAFFPVEEDVVASPVVFRWAARGATQSTITVREEDATTPPIILTVPASRDQIEYVISTPLAVGWYIYTIDFADGEGTTRLPPEGPGIRFFVHECDGQENCNDGNECTDDLCESDGTICADGLCEHGVCVFQNNTATCDDGDACTASDRCAEGNCVAGLPLDCDDENVCTNDSCNPATGCVHVNNTAACSDGNACTTGDVCSGGACGAGAPVACPEAQSCNPTTGVCEVLVVSCVTNADCDDGNVCTSDSCNPATGCVHANNTVACSDGSACTTNDRCSGGACVSGPPPNCNDENECTNNSCNPATGCVHTNNAAPCSDGNACTTGEVCSGGACSAGDPVDCPAGQSCNPTTEECEVLVVSCATNADCNDGNVCTNESCNLPTGECVRANNTAPCSDGSACTTNDRCSGGVCAGGPAPNCNDGNNCTDDSCNPATGCAHANNNAPCSDGSACTTNDTCSGGACVGGPPPNCNDGNVCTNDSCNPATGCVHANNTALCNDGNACTTSDRCSGGACVGGPPPNCNDGNVCSNDSCDPATGCVHANNTAPCSDGNDCTTGDACSSGACGSGAPVVCPPPQSCNPATGACEGNPACISFSLVQDNLTGTIAPDVFCAPLEFNLVSGTLDPTLQTGDSANGGNGTDELIASLSQTAVTTITATLSSIEELSFTDLGTAVVTLTGTNWTGVTSVSSVSSTNTNALVINNLSALAGIGLSNTNSGINVGFQTAATSGKTDALTLTLNNAGNTTTNGTATITTGGSNGIERVNLIATGSNVLNALTQATSNTLARLNISGAGTVQINTALGNSVTTVNATANTGGVNVTVGNGVVAATGGLGNDTFVYANNYTTADTINGGVGTDTLSITTGVSAPTSNQTNVSNMEALTISDAHTAATTVSRFGSITTVNLPFGSNGGSFTLSSGSTVNFSARGANNDSAGTFGAAVSGSGTADGLTMNVNDSDFGGTVTLTGVETCNLLSNLDLDGSAADGNANTFVAFTMADTAANEVLNVTGTAAITFNGNITANTINASTFTQAFTMTLGSAALAGAGTITTGSGNDTLVGSAGADILNSGSGNDTIYGAAGSDTINGGEGNDVLNGGAGDDTLTGGSGADTFQFDNSVASGGHGAQADVVSDWVDGTDFIAISAGNTFGSAGTTGLAQAGGAAGSLATTANGSVTIVSIAQSAGATPVGAGQFIKLTTGVATGPLDQANFNSAIGTSTVTGLTAGTSMAGAYFDTATNQAVIFEVDGTATTNSAVQTGDTIRVIARVNMSAASYTTLTGADLGVY